MAAPDLPFHLDPARPTPLYVQLIEQIRYHLARGTLRAEDELPSVRTVSSRYLVNPNTVVRAYQELERDGLVYKKRGLGTFVSRQSEALAASERERIVTEALAEAWRQARALGVPARVVRSQLDRILKGGE
jgi:GntR family transcriptional regulator